MSDRVLHFNSLQAWETLTNDVDSQLVDVRTTAEWDFVGVPDLSSISKKVILLSWLGYPDMDLNSNFQKDLSSHFGDNDQVKLFFICRSGGRSLHAAEAVQRKGCYECINIHDGFEGEVNPVTMHRNELGGWKYNGLPWRQS